MQQLILLLTKYRNNLLFIALLLFALVRHTVKNQASEHLVNRIGTGLTASYTHAVGGWNYYWSLQRVNEELARENAGLRASLYSSQAPDFVETSGYEFIPAKVVEFSYKRINNMVLIDAGTNKGISPGMGVITSTGWVGTVSKVTGHYAYVVPFVHSKGSIGGRIEGKGLGELIWNGKANQAIITDIEREFMPVAGDSIYSYTRALVAPPVLTGIVQEATQNQEDLSWKATVQMTTDFTNLSWVYVCKFIASEELENIQPDSE